MTLCGAVTAALARPGRASAATAPAAIAPAIRPRVRAAGPPRVVCPRARRIAAPSGAFVMPDTSLLSLDPGDAAAAGAILLSALLGGAGPSGCHANRGPDIGRVAARRWSPLSVPEHAFALLTDEYQKGGRSAVMSARGRCQRPVLAWRSAKH